MLKQEWGYDYLGHLRSPQQPIEVQDEDWSYTEANDNQDAMPRVGEFDITSPAFAAPQSAKRKQRAAEAQFSPDTGLSVPRKRVLASVKEEALEYEVKAPEFSLPPAVRVEKKQKGKRIRGESLGRGGRPVTWFGGGGMNPQDLVGLGVPKLRALFLETFGHHTASNNGSWLRRKLCEKPDAERGRGRSAAVRKRDQGAAIWTTGAVRNITQAEANVLVTSGPVLANGSFIAIPESSDCANDAGSAANSPHDTPSVTPTKHIQHKVAGGAKPTRLTYSWGKPSRKTAKDPTPAKSPTQRPLCFEGASSDAGAKAGGEEPVMVRRLLQRCDLADAQRFKGQQVELFWPEDATWWLARIIKLNSKQCQVVYETGETEELQVDELIRDGIMSLGWVPAPGSGRPDSAGELSVAGEHHCDARYRSPKSVHIKASPQQSTPGLTPELCQLINAEVDVRRAASLDNVCDSSDLDTGDQLQVVEYGLQPVVSPAAAQLSAEDLREIAPMELVRTAGTMHHPPLDHDTQAWADNLLLTARKVGAPLDRRRDGSQESCTSTALHNLQQELGMARQAAQDAEKAAGKGGPAVHALEYRFGSRQPLGFTMKSEANIASVTGPVGPGEGAAALTDPAAFDLAALDTVIWNDVLDAASMASDFAF
ncbi:g4128 [Coccomyxa viridis]|uniref:G4128 protein n=1 Tax=Coccomyxa viridis TaxID=1274662 RepID=A0ABP1FPM4_9CHLO